MPFIKDHIRSPDCLGQIFLCVSLWGPILCYMFQQRQPSLLFLDPASSASKTLPELFLKLTCFLFPRCHAWLLSFLLLQHFLLQEGLQDGSTWLWAHPTQGETTQYQGRGPVFVSFPVFLVLAFASTAGWWFWALWNGTQSSWG